MQENNFENIENTNKKTYVSEKNNVQVKKIVPSYLNKKNISDDINKKGTRGPKSKISLVIILILAIVLVIVVLLLVRKLVFSKNDITSYTKTAINYGYDNLYNTKSAIGNENITKFEALKLIVGAVYNNSNINEIYVTTYKNEEITEEVEKRLWLDYLKELNMTSEEEDNLNKDIKLRELSQYLSQAKSKLMNKSLDTINKASFSDLSIYSNDEINAIQDLVINGVIENSSSKFNGNSKVKKQQFNEILIKFVNKYNLITLEGDKINIDASKEPDNKEDYTYTLSSVKKNIYEIPKYNEESSAYISPVELFKTKKGWYKNIKQVAEGYLNTILNVDYNTINTNDYLLNINNYTYYKVNQNSIQKYIDYVKQNKIKISGTAKVCMPIVYYDGSFYRVRCSITYNLESSNANKKILYGDDLSINNFEYSIGERQAYLDIPLKKLSKIDYLMVVPTSINGCISGEVQAVR